MNFSISLVCVFSKSSIFSLYLFQDCGDGGLECSVCRSSFSSQQDFTRHIRSHNRVIELSDGSRMFECGLCGKQLSSNSSLDRHLLVHSGERPFRCHICGTHFTTNGNMHRHIRGHYRSGGAGSDTGDSDGGSDNGSNSCRKRRSELGDGPEPKLPKLSESDNEDCIDRPRSSSPNELQLDFSRVSEPVTDGRPCGTCGKRFATVPEWILHMREHSMPSSLLSRDSSLDLQQNGRGIRFSNFTQSSMVSSSPSSHSDLSHDEQFAKDYKVMKLNGQYPCRLCKEVFSNLRKLKSHNLVHMINPPYRCNLCSFYSNDKNALKEHMKGHKGDTPYECKLCGLAFTTKANCERHIKNIHSKQTRDEVKECMSYNAQEDGAEAPERSPDTICQICNIDCKSRSVLRDHMRSSHPEGVDKPFSCRICRFSFMNNTDTFRHLVQAHPEAVTSGSLTSLVEIRDPNERSHDLSSVESLITISKIPPSLVSSGPQTMPDHVTITPTVSQFPTFPSVLSPAMPPIMSPPEPRLSPALITIRPQPAFPSQTVDDDAPLDLSVNKRPNSSANDYESHDSESDERINITDDLDSSPDPKSASDILKIPKHPFPLMFPGNLPMSLQHFQQQYPFYMPPFNSLAPQVNNFSRALLDEYQENIRRRGIQLSSGGSLLSQSNGNFLTNPSSLALSVFAQAAKQEPHRVPALEPINNEVPIDTKNSDEGNHSVGSDDNEVQHFTMRNSVLVRKPKQRRYRTERPWRCNKCDKGFTLRSNMERHMKQQHPDIWMQKPRGTTFGLSRAAEAVEGYEATPNSTTDIGSEDESIVLDGDSKINREEEESNLVIDDEIEDESEEEHDEDEDQQHQQEIEKRMGNEEDNAQDLASVTTLLSKATTQSFSFFRNGEDEPENTGDEDDDSNGMRSPDSKKSSAYSSAPQKQKCPYCERKFPWSSSLIRHIRTHTGQKPYLCDVCNYPFTTKSNCDRHLLRKHPDSVAAMGGYRPYRCSKCPNAAFTSNEALRRHEMIKHDRPPSKDGSDYTSLSSQNPSKLPSSSNHLPSTLENNSAKEQESFTFQCFACDTPLPPTRASAIRHVSEEHPDLYQSLDIPEYPPPNLDYQQDSSNRQMTPPASTHADTVSW